MSKEETNNIVENPKILGAVEVEKLDLRPFKNQKARIEKVEYVMHEANGMYVKLSTNVLEGSPKGREVRASVILGLIEKVDTETDEVLGYGWGKESKTASFLQKMEVDTLEDLKGVEVIVLYDVVKGKDILRF